MALLFLGVIAERAFGDCAPVSAQKVSESGIGHSKPAHSDDEHACHCVCHHAFVSEHVRLKVTAAKLLVFLFEPDRVDFPPDAIPLGIDHPPQLA